MLYQKSWDYKFNLTHMKLYHFSQDNLAKKNHLSQQMKLFLPWKYFESSL